MSADFIHTLKNLIGDKYVLTKESQTRRYATGYRFGRGKVLAVARPGTLLEQWQILKACIAAQKIVIMQAANTGLTGGSTPDGDDYDRDIVIISTLRMNKVKVIQNGKQAICFPGTTLDRLEKTLAPLGREPHSVIGSSCIGASVFGGICNNSGGALLQRGPAYTQLCLFAQVTADGTLQLVNHLGIALGSTPEEMLKCLEEQGYTELHIEDTAGLASDPEYINHVRDVDADTPARFNADPRRLYEASGCAGKVILFAARLDTFPKEEQTKVFYIGTNDPDDLTRLRRHMLSRFKSLPVSAEYLHRDAFDIAETYGKDVFLALHLLGTDRMPLFFSLKSKLDALLPANLSDRFLQGLARLFPAHLPKRMKDFRARFEHHLLLKTAGAGIDETRSFLKDFFAGSASGTYFECEETEAKKAFLHRFAAAAAAVRYRALYPKDVEDIIALDIALKRNETDWVERLPADIDQKIGVKLYYGHFFCHVFHQDYIVKKGYDCREIEHSMCQLLDQKGAEYPAEHNVGHLYTAKPALQKFYKEIDPCNCFNPGIGRTSKRKNWS
ncbi:MAG TPA: D-lactate dehydrogenase [Alphaproteobacteria bacterium]|nr:D-lactate dehydrogenase [Alphaproteobacteria bacterium]